jgi:hypothetical protein
MNTWWDSNAYGNAACTIVGFHTSLLVLDFPDTLTHTFFVFVKGCGEDAQRHARRQQPARDWEGTG